MKQLQASEILVHKVFSSDFDFRIPEYQRPYAWGPEQAGQLLEDVTEAMGRSADEPYFLGSVVLVKEPGSPSAEVIDGQQRLTTLTILFAVLRDLADNDELRAELAALITEPGRLIQSLEPKPRLALRPRDREFFGVHVQTVGSIPNLLAVRPDALKTDAQQAVQANASHFWKVLSEWSSADRLGLVQRLSTQTMLVVVSTPDLSSAHRIFSVMNARGLDLSPTDIFKATVIGGLPESESELYAGKWEGAEEDLGRGPFLELFLHLRTIESKTRARRELLKSFRNKCSTSICRTVKRRSSMTFSFPTQKRSRSSLPGTTNPQPGRRGSISGFDD